MELNEYTATELVALLERKKISAVELAQTCLRRVEAREQDVQSWAYLDPGQVLAQARARDNEPPRGPLHGIPIGVKDIIDTFDMPTAYGSPIYAGHQPSRDAACVALLREAGAVIMGKTVTVELAAFHWAPTRNPHDLERTPGGSSSGSAAAVADNMVPLALGNQTGGSTIRPAAFCGIVGYKPSFNLVNRAGMKPLAESQDTVGLLARSVPDVALMVAILSGCAAPDFTRHDTRAVRIGICTLAEWPPVEAAMASAMEDAAARLARSGAHVQTLRLPQAFSRSLPAQRDMNDYEAWRALSHERLQHWDELSSTLQQRLAAARECTYEQYVEARNVILSCRALLGEIFTEHDVLITPSVPGEAPKGLTNTGDSSYNRIWTAFHTPTVSLPVFRGEHGLPMGLQVIGPSREDPRTLGIADWILRALRA